MIEAILTRFTDPSKDDQGTFGELVLASKSFRCSTLELPWRGNLHGTSCIPEGLYDFKWRTDSPKHGECYEAAYVPNRDAIQIHSANLSGDAGMNFVAQLLGCIALGNGVDVFKKGIPPAGTKDQMGVTGSRSTMRAFHSVTKGEALRLWIRRAGSVTHSAA